MIAGRSRHDNLRAELVELECNLPGIPFANVAELLAIDTLTARRWKTEMDKRTRRLRLVNQLVDILKHGWTPKGIMAWFHRPRRDLDGNAPIDLLDNPGSARALLIAAQSSSDQYAT